MRYQKLTNQLKGFTLATSVQDKYGRTLVTAGAKIDNRLLRRLKSYQIYGVYIDDQWSKGIYVEPAISNTDVLSAIDALDNLSIERAVSCANSIVESLSASPELANDVASLQMYDENTYMHSINVAIDSVTVGLGLGLSVEDLNTLSAGSLLHDVGKKTIPEQILNKPGKLSDDEYKLMKTHTTQGYEILRRNSEISSCVRSIALQHHENWDGTGYPNGLAGEKIYHLASIVHVCDVYDALISKRSYKEAYSFQDSIEIIKSGSGTQFDPSVVEAFFQYVPIYNKGTVVNLNTGERAVIVRNVRGDMLHPVVRMQNREEVCLADVDMKIVS